MGLYQQIEILLGFTGGVGQEPIVMWVTGLAGLLSYAWLISALLNLVKGGDKW